MCSHVLLEIGCTSKRLLAYFAQIADSVGVATHNQRVNINETTSGETVKYRDTLNFTHGRSPECVIICFLRMDARAKVFLHTSHR